MFLVMCFQNSFFNFSKKEVFIVYIREIPWNFADAKKMNPDERTLSRFIDPLICHNCVAEGIEYMVLSDQVQDLILF